MAQSGYTPISLYYSTTAAAVPTAGNLANGELALNIADMKLYAKNSAGTVTLLASNASTTGVDSLSFGSTGLTPSTATTGAITVAGTLNVANGGTGLTSLTAGYIPFGSGTSAFGSSANLFWDSANARLGIGTTAPANKLTVAVPGNATLNTPAAYAAIFNSNDAVNNQYYGIAFTNSNTPEGGTQKPQALISCYAAGGSWTSNWAGDLVFATASGGATAAPTEKVRILASGNVGIGTSSPATKLQVNFGDAAGNLVNLVGDGATSGTAIATNWNTGGSYFDIRLGGTTSAYTKARISSGGAMMVGTTTGTERLTLASGSGVGAAMAFWGNGGSAGNELYVGQGGSNEAYFFNRANTFIAIATNGLERVRVSAAGGFSVGTTADPGAGAIYATGNITAYYSDDRLKTRLGVIENALDKVDQLQGFYYEANETAQALGYKVKREVGVSAQSVQAVLPEIVSPAPIDQQYLTVDYERLVPLLIEAVKELRAEVKALKGE